MERNKSKPIQDTLYASVQYSLTSNSRGHWIDIKMNTHQILINVNEILWIKIIVAAVLWYKLSTGEPCGLVQTDGVDIRYTSYQCAITEFPNDVTTDTTILDIADNDIVTLSYDSEPIPIANLTASRNLIELFPNLTAFTTTLTFLDLQRNKIASIDPDRLDVLTNLITLKLSYNLLATIPDVPGPASTLATLALAGNKNLIFPVLANLGASLKTLNLAGCRMTTITQHQLSVLVQLKSLSLNNNGISTFPNLTLLAGSLTTLWLAKNDITVVPPSLLEPLTKLVKIYLFDNDLMEFPDLTPVLGNLIYADVSRNPTTVASSNLLAALEGANNPDAEFVLDGMGLTTIPPGICGSSLPQSLSLVDNLFHCDCNLRWLKMAEMSGIAVTLEATPCTGPAHKVGRTWSTIDIEDLQCQGKTTFFYSRSLCHIL